MAGYKLVFKGLKKFNADLEKFGERTVPAAHLALQKKIAIDLFGRIIEKNPVGNPSIWDGRAVGKSYPPRKAPKGYVGGRSRGNWQMSVGIVGETSLLDFDQDVNKGDAVSATQEIEAFNALSKAKPYQTIWIFNNVRYIKRLEDGWSTQAPAGMVSLSVAEIQAGLAD